MILQCGGRGIGASALSPETGRQRFPRVPASDHPCSSSSPLPSPKLPRRPSSRPIETSSPATSETALRVLCISTGAAPGRSNPAATAPISRKQSAGGALPSLLRRLGSSGEPVGGVREILDPYAGRLSPKEFTVLLKEQRDWRRALQVFRWMRAQGEFYFPNPIHYNVVLRALGRAQEWDELRRCWADMAGDGVAATNTTYGILIDVFGRAGLVREALLWLRHMRNRGVFPDEIAMNTAVRVLKDAGELDLGEKLYTGWCAGTVDAEALLAGLRRAGPSEKSKVLCPRQFLLTEMFRCGAKAAPAAAEEPPSRRRPRLAATFNTLIDLYGKAGRLGDASEAFADMLRSGVAPDTTTFNTMINVCGAHVLLPEAEALLEKMEERRIRPDAKTFNIFMSLHAAAGETAVLLSYYRRLGVCGLRPDAVTQRIVLGALCKHKMVPEAEQVMGELAAGGAPLDEQVLPAVTKMYVEEGMLRRAAEFFDEQARTRRVSSKIYAAVADVYAERGMWEAAEAVFSANEPRCRDLPEYNVMIKAYGRGKMYDRACEVFQRMRSRGVWPDECSYNSIVQMLAAGDQPEKAWKLLRRMREEPAMAVPRLETFSAVVASCARAGLPKLAAEVFEDMRRAGVRPNEVAYGSLIDALAGEDAGEARRRLEEMEAAGLPANRVILTSLIRACRRTGDWREAQRLYGRISRMEGGPDAAAGNCMIGVFADLGMVAEARAVLADLRSRGIADAASYTLMVRLYRNMGMLGDAAAAAEEMRRSGIPAGGGAAETAMAAFAGAGRLSDCGELLQEMLRQGISPNAATLRGLFAALSKAGVPPEAVAQLEEALTSGERLAWPAISTVVLAAAGMHREALSSGEELVGGGALPGMAACNAAMWAFGAAGKTGRALNLYMRMQDEGRRPDVVTCVGLARCYGGAGVVEGLNRIYSKLKHGEMEPSRSLFEAVTAAYRAAGRPDLAEVAEQEMRFTLAAAVETPS